jgi:hypothetical protein
MYAELTIDQGANLSSTIDLTNDDNTPINLTNTNFTCQIRKSYFSTNATANVTVTVESPAANGRVRLSMDAANTANIKSGRYLYDLKMIDASNNHIRVLEGIITITPQVTR